MINRQALLADLQKFLRWIEADLLERSESTEVPEVPAALHAEYEKAAKAERTAQNYEDWRTDTITQAAAAWVLSCVFVRFLEDNSLINPPKIAGPGDRLARARDEHELYFRSHPKHTDREYLLSIFVELAKLPGTKDIFGEHNAINDLPNWLSGDAAGELLNFFQKIDASTGELVHDFTDPHWDTRFLGDLYQDLSEAARKKFALLQTPDFVEEFILDRTLEPALDEFGLVPNESGSPRPASGRGAGGEGQGVFKMIDPACGSGHFLLGAFPRLLNRWQRKEPGTNIRELTQRALDSIHGVDINPFAVAIAKFRLLLVAMRSCDIRRLADAPAFHVNVACGDSLLHGENRTSTGQNLMDFADGATDQELYAHAYPGEDLQSVRTLLRPGTYHCVVANPPYIVPNDRKLNDWYRKRFSACHMKYSLAVPFMQQIFQLAVQGGFTGQITANSFMKREFGKKLIESFFPTVDLTHVIDTSGAYIPGHGTPTTVLFGRNRAPLGDKIRAVFGIHGEPSTPDDPAAGLVWTSITRMIDRANERDEFVSSADPPRSLFCKHPWSIGGGGLSELKERLDRASTGILSQVISTAGFGGIIGEDEAFVSPIGALARRRHCQRFMRNQIEGEDIRDWNITVRLEAIYPYDSDVKLCDGDEPKIGLWEFRTLLSARTDFGGMTYAQRGRKFWEYHQLPVERNRVPRALVYAEVSTHNHFVFDPGLRLYKHSVQVIKLPPEASDDDHFALAALLNSSTACFWMKQVCFPKGTSTGDISTVKGKPEANRFAFSATAIAPFPIPSWTFEQRRYAVQLAKLIHKYADDIAFLLSEARLAELVVKESKHEIRNHINGDVAKVESLRGKMIFLQEELDWLVYSVFGLCNIESHQVNEDDVPSVNELDRPFHGTIPLTCLPKPYRDLWKSRAKALEEVEAVRLIETSMYKRQWTGRQGVYGSGARTITEQQRERQFGWLLSRLESYLDLDGRMNENRQSTVKCGIAVISVAGLAEIARQDVHFQHVGELYRDDPAFDVQALVEELVLAESVPLLPILRYKDSGLRKRAEWEKTWDLQRREDAGEAVGTIPVPPKYTSADFISTGGARYWSLRGKLDVPKERWISFPHCEGPDGTLVICWAGHDHLQQAQAISAYYVRVQTEFGGSDDPRLIPLLASLIELLPWLKQWHNEPNANFDGLRMGDYFEGFVNEEARNLGKTLAEIKAWVPPKKAAKTAAPKSSTKKTSKRKVAEEASQAEAEE